MVLCDWVFFWWGPCLVCPMSMWFGMPGPRVPGGCSLVSRGSMGGNVRGDFLGPCLVFPLSMVWDAGAQGTEVPMDTPIPFDAMG